MDLNQKIIAGLLLAFFLITLLRIFRTPLRLALKLLMNTALGFLALWAVNAKYIDGIRSEIVSIAIRSRRNGHYVGSYICRCRRSFTRHF